MAFHQTSSSRIISASLASWARIIVTVITQIALIPLYLNSWSVETYGAWLLLQAIWGAIMIVDSAHQDYVGYECLKKITSTKVDRREIANIICSASPITFLIALWDLFLVWYLGRTDFLFHLVGGGEDLFEQFKIALLLLAATWVIIGNQGGLVNRWIIPFGYNPQVTWFAVLSAITYAVFPALAVYYGANLIESIVVLCISNIGISVVFYAFAIQIMKKHKLFFVRPNIYLGGIRAITSLGLAFKSIVDITRQQGIRIILAPIVGTAEMASFSTMRTGANFALQGLNTIAGPVMPELMRFLALRDQDKMEGTFSIVWLVLCGVLTPSVLVIQYLAPTLFPIWTHNKIIFNSDLFGTLSLSVLVFALSQPANAIIQGKNNLKGQIAISILTAGIVIGGIFIWVPKLGINGAAYSLLLAELVGLFFSTWLAVILLKNDALNWPWKAFFVVGASVVSVAFGLTMQILFISKFVFLALMVSLFIQILIALWYWYHLPKFVQYRILNLLKLSRNNKNS